VRRLDARITQLEQRVAADSTCYVAYETPQGLIPSRPGTVLTRHVAVLPRVCNSTDEWLAKYVPMSVDGKFKLE
jgi:hypothetical protein